MKKLELRISNVLFSIFCKGAALYGKTCAYLSQSMPVDVLGIDVIWPEVLSRHLLDLKKHVRTEEIRQHFPLIIENATVNGRLVAMPYFADVGLLYYRKDLLLQPKYENQIASELAKSRRGYKHIPGNPDDLVPKTWDELARIAKLIQDTAGKQELWGFIWQGSDSESLTCNALEWIASQFEGSDTKPDVSGHILNICKEPEVQG